MAITATDLHSLIAKCYIKLPKWVRGTTIGTCTHLVFLLKEGKIYGGVYNGLTYWGRVYEEHLVDELYFPWDEEEKCHPNFTEEGFEVHGYELVRKIEQVINACKYPLDFSFKPEGGWSLSYTCKKGNSNLTIIEINRHPNSVKPAYSVHYVSHTPGIVIRRLEVMDEELGDDLSFVIPFLSKHGLVK